MKMEVLSVQNQFQGHQFGVIGSNKVKDWTSPLTPPPSSHHHHHHHKSSNNSSVDEVDTISRNQNHRHHTNSDNTTNLRINNLVFEDTNQTSPVSGIIGDNNLIATNNISESSSFVSNFDTTALNALSLRLQSELRAAKSRHLACTEVLLPSDLLHRVAVEIFKVSEKEPCGLRGCTVFIEFEDEPSNTRRIASLKIDPNTVSTFELYLTLKHDKSGWTSILPQFLKNLARSSTIMISPEFILTKNKLYHSFAE
ncbi:protein scylla [Condylostylus longicornis]|uniref:protein scylla n=1 Tax=Condylostylus longicornis TaxID=2530218 RepID=UPI00244DD8E1|nr:protein scylla [Condylostylus longicornis]